MVVTQEHRGWPPSVVSQRPRGRSLGAASLAPKGHLACLLGVAPSCLQEVEGAAPLGVPLRFFWRLFASHFHCLVRRISRYLIVECHSHDDAVFQTFVDLWTDSAYT